MSLFIIITFSITHVADQQLRPGGYDHPGGPSGGRSRGPSGSYSSEPGAGPGGPHGNIPGGTGPSAGHPMGPSARSYTNAPSGLHPGQLQ